MVWVPHLWPSPSSPPPRWAGPPTLRGLLHMAEPAQDWRPRALLHQGVSEHCGRAGGAVGAREGTGKRRASVQAGMDRAPRGWLRTDGQAGCTGGRGEALVEPVSESRQAPPNPTRKGHPIKPLTSQLWLSFGPLTDSDFRSYLEAAAPRNGLGSHPSRPSLLEGVPCPSLHPWGPSDVGRQAPGNCAPPTFSPGRTS